MSTTTPANLFVKIFVFPITILRIHRSHIDHGTSWIGRLNLNLSRVIMFALERILTRIWDGILNSLAQAYTNHSQRRNYVLEDIV